MLSNKQYIVLIIQKKTFVGNRKSKVAKKYMKVFLNGNPL